MSASTAPLATPVTAPLELSDDPEVAEQQIEAVLTFLTACGYVDDEFDLRERTFVRSMLHRLVVARLERPDDVGEEPTSPELRFERMEQLEAHYLERFEALEREVRALRSEAVVHGETEGAFAWSRLQLRCFELFAGLSQRNRAVLMDLVDTFIAADGIVHPEELRLRNELAEALSEAHLFEVDPLVEPAVELRAAQTLAPPLENHPFFESSEEHYAADREVLRTQVETDLELLDEVSRIWAEARESGAGMLVGRRSVDELPEGRYLDGFIHVERPRPDEDFELIVLGDLHGCYSCLKAAVLQSDFMGKVRRCRAEPSSAPRVSLVLLGDYIDRGRFSYNGVLRTVLKLLAAVPEHVYVLRGNHEYYIDHEGDVLGGVSPADAINSLKAYLPRDVFTRYRDFFDEMPSMLLYDRLAFVHGGMPREHTLLSCSRDLTSLNDPRVRFEMMWSDPSRADWVPRQLQERSARFSFGRRQFRAFMERLGCTLLVRGHEKIEEGFREVYPGEDPGLFTLFSAGGEGNEDLPADSSYRQVTPMALTLRRVGGTLHATPWAIDYRRYQSPEHNAFFRTALEIDI